MYLHMHIMLVICIFRNNRQLTRTFQNEICYYHFYFYNNCSNYWSILYTRKHVRCKYQLRSKWQVYRAKTHCLETFQLFYIVYKLYNFLIFLTILMLLIDYSLWVMVDTDLSYVLPGWVFLRVSTCNRCYFCYLLTICPFLLLVNVSYICGWFYTLL